MNVSILTFLTKVKLHNHTPREKFLVLKCLFFNIKKLAKITRKACLVSDHVHFLHLKVDEDIGFYITTNENQEGILIFSMFKIPKKKGVEILYMFESIELDKNISGSFFNEGLEIIKT